MRYFRGNEGRFLKIRGEKRLPLIKKKEFGLVFSPICGKKHIKFSFLLQSLENAEILICQTLVLKKRNDLQVEGMINFAYLNKSN